MSDEKIIEVNNLYSVYAEKTEQEYVALNNINYKFFKNKIYCIIGNSGSGKSTLVTHFNGLMTSKYGEVKTPIVNIGFNWGLDKLKIMPLDKTQDNLNDELSRIIVINTKKLNTSIARIIISGNYKVKIDSIKRIKNLNWVKEDFSAFIIKLNPENKFEIKESYPMDYIQNFNIVETINNPSYKQKRKMKKIKEFKKLRKEIGMVFQFPEYQLFKDTIEKDIMFGPVALGMKKDEAKKSAKFFLNKLGMGDEFLPRNPFGLSGGQKRRVAIAGILAIDTNVLIFDEPTAGLDPVGEQEMMDIILDAKANNKSVFVITHTMDHVLQIADEVIVMNDGEIIAHGTPYDIFMNDYILESTSIDTPKVIKTIKNLIQKDASFAKLLDKKPKTVEELASTLIDFLSGEQ